eukprot:TRINITY_DN6798_c0_g1_i1.p1 TRINITY_DN6798_c0_g1~~TRINITY_DN6798_c0_g1_i1.p1  ORF type:complete len:457 (-),score=89.60 TRINITY_DN6798_c0_g1_i1:9-1379(-)
MVTTSMNLHVKVYIYRNIVHGSRPWMPEDGELEKDNPQWIILEHEQTTTALKITRNSFQDKEGTKRTRGQVVSVGDLFQFQLVIREAHTEVMLWRSDPFYVLSCSKKGAKEWFDQCCMNNIPSSVQTNHRKKRSLDISHIEPEPQNKFLYIFIIGMGPTTPLVLQKNIYLSELRKEISDQQLQVPQTYQFVHPNFVSNFNENNGYQTVTEPQEKIVSTRDFKDDKVVLLPVATPVVNAIVEQKLFTPTTPELSFDFTETKIVPTHNEDHWAAFCELYQQLNMAQVLNITSAEKSNTVHLFFQDFVNMWGAHEAVKYFFDNIQNQLQHQFHGVLSKEELTLALSGKEIGTFCVRVSLTQKRSLVVSYVSEQRQILSIPMELSIHQKPFHWRIFNPVTNTDELFESVASYLKLITMVAHKPLIHESSKTTQSGQPIYSDSKQQMHESFWVKKFFSNLN